jgi:hypothetical protein
VKREAGGRGLLLIEVTCKERIINIAEYLNTKYPKDQFVNIVIKRHECNKPNMNGTIKKAADFAKELNQSNENSDTKRKAFIT